MSKNLNGSIALTKLKHVRMEADGQNGKVDGLFIPIDANFLIKGKNDAVYVDLTVFINDEEDDYGNIASIKQNGKIQGKKWAEMSEEEKKTIKELPYLGNLKDFSGSSSDNTGAASDKKFTPKNKLPF